MIWLLACARPNVAPPEPAMTGLQWLSGGWTESYLGEAVASEHWWNGGEALHGVSFVVREGKTASFEVMCIESDDGALQFRANPPGQGEGIFPAVKVEPARIRFENPAHDYPTSIEYVRTRDGVHAAIAGPGGANPYAWDFVGLPPETAPTLESVDRALAEATDLERGAAWADIATADAQLAGGARVVGPKEIAAAVDSAFDDGAGLRWAPAVSGLSSVGDAGFTAGRWSTTRGRKVTANGSYLTVWRKDADGTWRLAMHDASGPWR